MKPPRLLQRLDAIGDELARSGHARALIGLGSVGQEVHRLDDYSDLDFFVIVEPGYKTRYIEQLDWLAALCPIAYAFRNTGDGYKLLFADGIFCEFAVFEPHELEHIPFAPGRVVWKQPQVDDAIGRPVKPPAPAAPRDPHWLVGEALTNLYVGLGRDKRGEKLSGMRFIQSYAVDRLLELAPLIEAPAAIVSDSFSPERRFEARYPSLATHLPTWMPGYQHNPAAARAILAFLEGHFDVNAAMAAAIRAYLE